MTHAYWFDFGTYLDVADYYDGWARQEKCRLSGIVIAETRGRARVLALDHARDFNDYEWNDLLHLRKLEPNDSDYGVLDWEDPLHIRLWEEVRNRGWLEEDTDE